MLTINDIRGTNPTLWNSWKHDLLKQLFMSSRRKLNLEEVQSNKSIVAERKLATINVIKKGHEIVRVFFYHDGVNNANKFGDPPSTGSVILNGTGIVFSL